MMSCLLSVVAFAIISNLVSAYCPNNYTLDTGISLCYKIYTVELTRIEAATQCFKDGAKLATIPNAFINAALSTQGQNQNTQLWIGLLCDQNSICSWDDGTPYGVGAYKNFFPGYPNADVGLCTYMTTSGRWLNGDCSLMSMGFACVYIDNGDPACDDYAIYNNQCYHAHPADPSITNPEEFCYSQGGHLTSINNQAENDFVTSLLSTDGITAMIGLFTNSTTSFLYYWTDGTAFSQNSFSNFGVLDPTKGFCVSILGADQSLGFKGAWVTAKCDVIQAFVCKRAIGAIPPVITTVAPYCPHQTYTLGQQAASPGFPSYYYTCNCTYSFTTTSGFVAGINFDTFYIDDDSKMYLYNSPTSSTPFATLISRMGMQKTYYSDTSTIYILFYSPYGALYNDNMFRGTFVQSQTTTISPKQSIMFKEEYQNCPREIQKTPGIIHTPTKTEDVSNGCLYQIQSKEDKCVQLKLATQPDSVKVTVYNGLVEDNSFIVNNTRQENGLFYYRSSGRFLTILHRITEPIQKDLNVIYEDSECRKFQDTQ